MTHAMTQPLGVSIVVVNFNYGRFLASAVDSALGQDHPLCEVIVVDDCSSDDSRAVIGRYGHRVRPVLMAKNSGQVVAMNSAWPLARYPIVIFLDADDVLLPHAAATVAGLWTDATVKTQFLLETVDETGRRLGHVTPRFPHKLKTAALRTALLATGQSPSSPGSGNAYSRSLLARVDADGGFDIENPREHHMDSILECNAPFYGEVATIHEPLVCRRIHHSNLYAMNVLDSARFAMMSDAFAVKLGYLASRCRAWGIAFDPDAARNRAPWLLECRLVVSKLAPAGDPREPIRKLLFYGLRAYIGDDAPMKTRMARVLWFVGVAISPRRLASRLIALRFLVTQRPRWFERLFAMLTKSKGSAWRGSLRTWEPRM